jgi:hypothetical protein
MSTTVNTSVSTYKPTHRLVTDYYAKTDPLISTTMRVRDWLVEKSFEYQYEFGKSILKKFGVSYE